MIRFITGLRCHLYIPQSFGAERAQRRPEELERREVRREQNDALAFGERGCEVLRALDIHALAHGLRVAEPAHRHLDDRQAERLEVLRQDPRSLRGWQIRKARIDVARRYPAPFAQERVGETPQRAAQRHLHAERQANDEPHPGVAEPGDGIAQGGELSSPEVI